MTSLLNIAGNIPVSGVEEGQSLRFEDGDSAYLSRTPASAGDTNTWTWSGWVKRGNLGSGSYISLFGAVNGILNSYIAYNTTYQALDVGQGATVFRRTSAVFRDSSAWYHVVVASDTTQATAANRIKIYINNEEVTSFSSTADPSQNSDWYINDTFAHAVGAIYPSGSAGYFFDGYLANVTFIDGTALTPTSFGEYDDTLWKPKSDAAIQALTFGTNGFYLAFEDSSAIGDDTSGNANDWTANNLVATDAVLDSPVTGGNFATYNSVLNSSMVLSEGNLEATQASAAWVTTAATFAVSSGKWYWESKNTGGLYQMIGIVPDSFNSYANFVGVTADSYSYYPLSGQASSFKYNNNVATVYGNIGTTGDIFGVALDLDAGTLEFFKNNVSQGVAFTGLSGTFSPALSHWTSDSIANFGQDSSFAGTETPQGNTDDNGVGDFYYAPPSGFLALTTGNLPAATITAPDEYFNTALYTGSGADQSIGSLTFQPDFVWIKNRTFGTANNSYSHALFDSVRGVGRDLNSNETSVESPFSASFSLTSFDSNGFSISDGGTLTNASGSTYASWNWLADGTSVLNQQGTIDSQVSANTDAGFSIVSFTSPATSSTAFTIGHGLSSAPEMIITKERDGTLGWLVYHDELPSPKDNYLLLNSTAANSGTVTDCWGTSAPTSSVFGMKTSVSINPSKSTIAYCFHSVEGYSKIGSYTGSAPSLPFVHCGFRPAWIMLKRTDDSGSWFIFDNERSGYNADNDSLSPDLTESEFDGATFNFIDILSNGFKMRDTFAGRNASGGSYIFLAFAEASFTRANAR
jgi:hypothetical protein